MLSLEELSIKLNDEEKSIFQGEKGSALQKVMQSVVLYGEIFGADELIPIDGASHGAMAVGASFLKPYYRLLDELIAEGLKTQEPFTLNPRAYDFENVKYPLLEKLVTKFIYTQGPYEERLHKIGLRDEDAFSCTCYLPEVGNIPKKDAILAWSESSAVVFVNSVLGARTNRNSVVFDFFCNILGKTPRFGLLTDEGRKANWIIEVKTSSLPNPHLLGSVIGQTVIEHVPYIKGLTKLLEGLPETSVRDYLKDMGAAAATSGAVGLFHVENLTPEAKEQGDALINPKAKTLVITEDLIQKTKDDFPVIWKNENAKPKVCMIGCPHLSLEQIYWWSEQLSQKLSEKNKNRVKIQTVLCAAPTVVKKFKEDTKAYEQFSRTGARLSTLCSLAYMANPITEKKPVITNSSKLRTYTPARYYTDEEILEIVT